MSESDAGKAPKCEPGDIVQVVPGTGVGGSEDPHIASNWDACLVIVTEVRTWGVQGYTTVPLSGDAYIRLKWDQFERVGRAHFIRGDEDGGSGT